MRDVRFTLLALEARILLWRKHFNYYFYNFRKDHEISCWIGVGISPRLLPVPFFARLARNYLQLVRGDWKLILSVFSSSHISGKVLWWFIPLSEIGAMELLIISLYFPKPRYKLINLLMWLYSRAAHRNALLTYRGCGCRGHITSVKIFNVTQAWKKEIFS